ncbi:MAG: trans-2-enoyl-CoA reductase family protein [Clostridia bacterium]|nr:trans-2-enoyl-CoA reductase family protein [Clostridia bacterium]
MIIMPKTRGFICTTAHPKGCAQNVIEQMDYIKKQEKIKGPKKVLIIGASTGYGLASRITAAFGAGADTLGVFFEKPASGSRTATAGWYNSVAFEKKAKEAGLYSKSLNGDAFSKEMKEQAIELIKKDLGEVDLMIYSLAAPKRVNSVTGEFNNSVIKPIGKAYSSKTVNFHSGEISKITIDPANESEIKQTIAVMGGEDWEDWIQALHSAGVLAKGVTTVAYSYIGPQITHAVYREGTIGKAKDHLEAAARTINSLLTELDGKAFVSINKALVTQSSSAIPVVPLYISILYDVMKRKEIHENCIEQMYRLFTDFLYADALYLDDLGRIRIDDLEMRRDVQDEVLDLWGKINSENISSFSDIEGYREDFFKLFGFGHKNIDYKEDVQVDIDSVSIKRL